MTVKIGLETHVQLNTESKAFCSCKNPVLVEDKELKPNTLCCETCLGLPGSKPRANEKMIECATKVALALNCEIAPEVLFSRKTYFYPDMAKNFQITQYEVPLAKKGSVEIEVSGQKKKITIRRIHIEEDPAKLIHVGGLGGKYVLVDYNRSGIPLIEIVTEPDFKSPQEARIYLQKLAMILEYLKIYDSSSEASIKTDANISIDGGERVEVKNITGTKEIEKALSYEEIRQKNVVKRGGRITQETRAWNPAGNITQSLRTKETEEDYGYIFEPDLTRIDVQKKLKDSLKKELPELPDQKQKRFIKQYSISEKLSESLVSEIELAELFEKVSKEIGAELAASWLAGPLKKTLNWNNLKLKDSGVKEEWITEVLVLFKKRELTDHSAEEVIRKLVEEKKGPAEIIKKYGINKIKATDEIERIIKKVLEENKAAVKDYQSGEMKALNFLVGQVMKASKGSIDANTARKIIQKHL